MNIGNHSHFLKTKYCLRNSRLYWITPVFKSIMKKIFFIKNTFYSLLQSNQFSFRLFCLTLVFSFTTILGTSLNAQDADGDGIANVLDVDDDNDGILDLDENTCTTSNIGLSGTASSSSVSSGGVPSRVIDGNTNGNYWGGSVAHTSSSSPHEWIDVDLGSQQDIFNIVVWNRTNYCCRRRLSYSYLMVSSTPFPNNTNLADAQANAEFSTQFGYTQNIQSINTSIQLKGRYIRIQKSGTNYGGNSLNVAERMCRFY